MGAFEGMARGMPLVRVNSGTLAALAAGEVVDLNLVALNQAGPVKDRIPPRLVRATLRGQIEDIVLYVRVNQATNPEATISFWANDSHNTTNLDQVKLWGQETLTGGDFAREGAGVGTSIWRGHIGGLEIPYSDEDLTGEFHVTVENNSTNQNWPGGSVQLEFGYRAEFGA
jgi:hypothetical protein